MTLEQYAKDIVNYLTTKLPDTPYHTVVEIAEYLTAKTVNYTQDMLWQHDKFWKDEIKRLYKMR